MKNYIWVAVLVWGWSVSAFADSLIGLGVKGGIDFGGEVTAQSYTVPQNSLVGPTGGIFTDIHLLDFFSLQLEANYIQKGTIFPGLIITGAGPGTLGTGSLQNTYQYLEIPLLIKLQKNIIPDLKGFIYVGPSLGFLLNETTSLIATPSSFNNSVNDTSYYPSTNLSLDFGGGVEWAGFILDIRYGLGIDSAAPTIDTTRTAGQLNTLSFQLGYRIF